MTMGQLATLLDGRAYGEVIAPEEERAAKDNGLVPVYGTSDDLMVFAGAIHDDVGCFDGGTAYLDETGLWYSGCDDDDCPYAEEERKKCKTIEPCGMTMTARLAGLTKPISRTPRSRSMTTGNRTASGSCLRWRR